MITRLAPTPSGYLHTGNIYNFLLNWLWARSNGGKVLLRIDDGDTERKRKEYVEDIFRMLDWLQLDWDIGPSGPDDFEKNWSQQGRKEMYNDLLKELSGRDMLFACDCSRKQICNCVEKNIPLTTTGVAWKIKVQNGTIISFPDKVLTEVSTDINSFVVRKKDSFASYQLSSLADDRHFGITHICRGSDLKESTAMQLYIDQQLSSSYFSHFSHCSFWHHPLLTSAGGEKFSKSAGTSGRSIVEDLSKDKLLSSFAAWAGINIQEEISLKSLLHAPVFKDN